jgi:hypothetical protein
LPGAWHAISRDSVSDDTKPRSFTTQAEAMAVLIEVEQAKRREISGEQPVAKPDTRRARSN